MKQIELAAQSHPGWLFSTSVSVVAQMGQVFAASLQPLSGRQGL